MEGHMIKKYIYGNPFPTQAVIDEIEKSEECLLHGSICLENGFSFTYELERQDIVYGLGEANRGINKRGYRYVSNCTDIPDHTEDVESLYGAHNFVIVDGRETFGLFLDYPGKMEFDIGYTRQDLMTICCERADLVLYVIDGDSPYDIVKQFRKIIGRSYMPPKFAFGYGQSRWGYKTAQDIRTVVEKHRANHIPIDMVYMDIDYMEDYKDFTVDETKFPAFPKFVKEMQEKKIHLVPIIDAGVKVQEGYDVYEEGKAKGYFCKRKDGSDFEAAVWPGLTHLPDVLNEEARTWFGDKYERLLAVGIDAFWNDMNEPAIFYSPEGVRDFRAFYKASVEEGDEIPIFALRDQADGLGNSAKDYASFYHNVDGKMVCHEKVHNLYGYYMTRAASEAFERICPEKRILMFSRSSYIGMHRYGGIWTGDNRSWWSHILLNLKMLPSLNMCGFLYVGADLGGFGSNTTRDLLLRWLALGVFTPLMRNHSCDGTRMQEVYQFEQIEDFRHVIGVRYRLIPYLYREYQRAVEKDDMMFKPLAFVYPEDKMARRVEDQLMIGDEIMIAPVYIQNADGRYVYLPEEMLFVKFMPDGSIYEEVLEKGHHYVEVALNEVPLFIRKNRCIPIVQVAESVEELDMSTLQMIGYKGEFVDKYQR